MRPLDTRIRTLAESQHGVVSRAQLVAEGWGHDAVRSRVRAGRLVTLFPGVYAVGHTALAPEGRWRAALWSCDPRRTWLSHGSAAALHGQAPADGRAPVHVTTLGAARTCPGRVVHRVTHLEAVDVTVRDGLDVVAPLRTLVDLSRTLTYPRFRALVDAQRAIDLEGLDRAAFRAGGSSAVNRLLRSEAAHTKSAFERRFVRWCGRTAIPPGDGRNVRIGRDTVDVVHRAARLVVELDGRAYHERRAQMRADRLRDQRLQLLGWRVVRLVWEDLDADATPATAATLRQFLASMGHG